MTNTPQVWPVGSVKQLLFDRRFIESSAGLQFTVNPPVQCTRVNLPLLPGLHFKGYLTVLDVDGQLWLYYYTAPNGSPSGHIGMLSCLAWSDDGIDWELAPVDKFEVSGLARNNVVMPGAVGTPFIDPQETCGCRFWFAGTLGQRKEPPFWKESDDTYFGYFLTAERDGHHGALYLLNSEDGISWRRHRDGIVVPFSCDSQNQVFHDARAGVYVAYLRGADPESGRRRTVARVTSPSLNQLPFDFAEDTTLRKSPAGLYHMLMPQCAPIVIAGDDDDPPATDIYTPCVNPYEWAADATFAFPAVYRHYHGADPRAVDAQGQPKNDGLLEVQLAVSRDGVSFDRFRTPYVGPGLLEEPQLGGTVYMGVGLVRRGNFIYQYYAEGAGTHGQGNHEVSIWQAKQRLDGFVSVDAGPAGGWFVTPPIEFAGSCLQLNIDCSAMGEALVELQDETGKPLPGFTFDDAVSVDRNGVAQEVWWQGRPDLDALNGRPIRLKFKMRSAKLYAFQFVTDPPSRNP